MVPRPRRGVTGFDSLTVDNWPQPGRVSEKEKETMITDTTPFRRVGDYLVRVDTATVYDATYWTGEDWSDFWDHHPGNQVGQSENMTTVTLDEMVLDYGDLANLTHETQVAVFGWCGCEDGPSQYDDCPRP